ncbi:hypothetical protein [Nocardiopsis sp. LOL_012]|uniref:hypothetical protein n=1 Tax=Nocardiopsis sp. LOL_012 TaxID=3345409 RepID=UPI003A878E48
MPTRTIEFVDDVPRTTQGRNATPWGIPEADALRANPHTWAIIARVPDTRRRDAARLRTRVGTIKRANTRPWADPHGRFEAHSRAVGGEVRLYARYVPHPPALLAA